MQFIDDSKSKRYSEEMSSEYWIVAYVWHYFFIKNILLYYTQFWLLCNGMTNDNRVKMDKNRHSFGSFHFFLNIIECTG